MSESHLTKEQVNAGLLSLQDIVSGAPTNRVLEYANDGRLSLGKFLLSGLVSGDLVIVPKSAIKQEPPNPARKRVSKKK